MKYLSAVISGIAVLALLTIVTLPNHNVAHAASACSVATLSGNYGFTENVGFIAQPPQAPTSQLVAAGRLGLITFSPGTGTFSLSFTQSVNGRIITDSTTGSYTVGSNCLVQ